MSDNNIKESKKFRKIPFLSSIMILYISFFAVIPTGLLTSLSNSSILDISLEIFRVDTIKVFIWGITDSGIITIEFDSLTASNIIPIIMWSLAVVSGLLCLIGSAYDEKPTKIKKFIKFSTFFLLIEFVYYIIIYFFWSASSTIYTAIGPGFIILALAIVLNIISIPKITDYHEIDL